MLFSPGEFDQFFKTLGCAVGCGAVGIGAVLFLGGMAIGYMLGVF